jgi:hypothetical protein
MHGQGRAGGAAGEAVHEPGLGQRRRAQGLWVGGHFLLAQDGQLPQFLEAAEHAAGCPRAGVLAIVERRVLDRVTEDAVQGIQLVLRDAVGSPPFTFLERLQEGVEFGAIPLPRPQRAGDGKRGVLQEDRQHSVGGS